MTALIGNDVTIASNLYVLGVVSNATYYGNGAGLTNVTAASFAETDPKWSAASNGVVTQAAHGETAYGWGDHATNGYATETYVDNATGTLHAVVSDEIDGDVTALSNSLDTVAFTGELDPRWSAVSNSVTTQAAHGETAYGWGDHATNGYIDGYSETDPVWTGASNQYLKSSAAAATYVAVSGDTMTGRLVLPSNGLVAGTTQLVLTNGNVGIGTDNPTNELAVNGTIKCKECVVTLDGWADDVFEEDYELMPLERVEQFVGRNGHLPDVPSARQVARSGVKMGAMQATLPRKIEELTLHMIALERENRELRRRVGFLEKR